MEHYVTQVTCCKHRCSQTQLIAMLFAPRASQIVLKSDGPLNLRRADAVFGFCFTRREKSVAKNCPRLITLFLRQTLPPRNLRSERRLRALAGICLPDFNTCRTFNQNLGHG